MEIIFDSDKSKKVSDPANLRRGIISLSLHENDKTNADNLHFWADKIYNALLHSLKIKEKDAVFLFGFISHGNNVSFLFEADRNKTTRVKSLARDVNAVFEANSDLSGKYQLDSICSLTKEEMVKEFMKVFESKGICFYGPKP